MVLCCTLLLILQLGEALAQTNTLVIDDTKVTDEPSMIDLTPHLRMWIDTSGRSSFPEIIARQSDFTPYQPAKVEHYDAQHNFWLSFELCGEAKPSKWYLGFRYPEVQFFRSMDGKNWSKGLYGYNVQEQVGTTRIGPDLFIPIQLEKNECHQFFFYCSPRLFIDISQGRMWNYHLKLSNRSYISRLRRAGVLKSLPLCSILLTIFFYHFVLFIYNQEKPFLYLSIFSLACGLQILNNGGYFIEIFQIQNIGSYLKTVPGTFWALMAISSPFTVSYLNLKSGTRTARMVKFLGWFWLISCLLNYPISLLSERTYGAYSNYFSINYFIGQFVFYAFYLFVGILEWVKGNARAPYYLLGFGAWFLGSTLTILFSFKIIPGLEPSPITFGVTELWVLGVTMGMLLFAFGLARQFKTLQEERAEADKQKAMADQARLLEQMEASRLREMDQFKSRLYTNITHEFRTPLTVISGMAQQLPVNNEEKAYILRNSDKLLDLVNQMLDLSKIEAGKLKPNLVQFNVISLLKHLSTEYKKYTEAQHLQFHLEILDDVIWMDMDTHLLQRICNNLVHNAIKFSPECGDITMRVQKSDQGQALRIQISDQGRGIPREEQEKIFDRFYQVDASNTRKNEGTGIGLALVKEIVSMLKGTITVQSEEYRGSTFTVVLPITHNAEIEQWRPQADPREINRSLKSVAVSAPENAPKILIVEDHSDVRDYLSQLIQPSYQVMLAGDGRMGLSKAFDEIPDLIVSDVMMPEMDGFEFCATIKSDPRTSHIPVILVTAKSTQDDKLDGLQEGADAYLIKPFDPRELLLRIEKLLEQREKVRQHYQRFQILPKEEIKENRFLQQVLEQLEENLQNENYQIEDLASAIHIGRVQLYRKLKALTGKTYTQVLREIRINRAKGLLQKTDKTSSEVAYEVGFRNDSYFAKVFKKVTGMTTSEFRNRHA